MRIRVYIAIILLLLLLIVSQVCALGASRLSKEPTYKIWAFNSINKATKVADRQWTRLSVWPWVGTLTFPASPETPHQRLQSAICVEKMLGHTIRMTLRFSLSSLHFSLAAAAFQMSVFRPAPVGRSVGKLLWKTLANTIRLSKSKKVYHILFALSTKIAKKCSSICFSIHFGGKNSVPPLFGVPAPADKQPYIRWKFPQVQGCFVDNLFLFFILAADQAIPQGITMQN